MPRRDRRGRAPHAVPDAPEARPPSYLELCEASREALLGGDAGAAESAARRALGLLSRGVEAQRLLGLALLERGEARPALHALAGALSCDPADVVAQTGVAEARELIDGPAAAEADWRRAWELDPGEPQVEARLQQSRRAAGALDGLDAPPLTRAALARIYLRGGLLEHAATEARTLLAREPDRIDLQLLLAEAFWKLGDAEGAAAVAGALLERQPDCVTANLLVAAHWHTVGRDISALMARVRAVDPAGDIADRLFEDREAPPLLEAEAAAAPYQRPASPETVFAAAVEAEAVAAGDLEDTQPLPVVALPEAPEQAPKDEDAPTPPQDSLRGQASMDEAEVEQEPVPEVAPVGETEPEDEPETEDAAEPDEDGEEQSDLPDDVASETAPTPALAASVLAAHTPADDESPVDPRRAGDAAMRERRYFDAVRAYGEALRAMQRAKRAS